MHREATYVCDIPNDFSNLERDGLSLRDNTLHCSGTDDMPKCCLRSLHKSLTQIRNAESCSVRVRDLEIDDGVAASQLIVDIKTLMTEIERTFQR